jgi:hypothetical protein
MAFETEFLLMGLGLIAASVVALWIAMPGVGQVSRGWLRSEVGGLYPLIPVILFVFGVFTVLKAFGLV